MASKNQTQNIKKYTHVEHVLKMSYKSIADDVSSFCDAYKRSLLPVKKEYDPTMDILIVFGTFAFLFLFVVCVVFYQRNKHLFKKKRIVKIISPYPKYTPKLDEFRNKFFDIAVLSRYRSI